MFKDKHGKEIHKGDLVVDSHGHAFTVQGANASFKGKNVGVVHVAFSAEVVVVHKAQNTIVWGGDDLKSIIWGSDARDVQNAAGADGDTIMWGT